MAAETATGASTGSSDDPHQAGGAGAGRSSSADHPAPAGSTRLSSWTNQPLSTPLPAANEARLATHALNLYGGARSNPPDFSISLRNRLGTDQQLHRPGARRQSMRGFEDHYVDIVDYIIRATHRAWEEKDIGYVYEIYRHNCIVRGESGVVHGRDRIIENSIGLLAAFPDLRWLPAEIVWAGDDETGFHTSHRSFFVGTNTGWSQFGPPTGRRCSFWAIANCRIIGNEIYDEHVIENAAGLVQQLGLDVREVARRTAAETDPDRLARIGHGETVRLLGQGKPEHMPPAAGGRFDPEDFVRRMLHYVWNWRMVGMTRDFFATNVRAQFPAGPALVGLGDYQARIMATLAMFPDLVHGVDDVYYMGNDRDGYVVAVRWTLSGTHRGHGIYGSPTCRRIETWGISHFEIRQALIVEEWTIFNEFNLLQQIYRDDP